MIGFLTEQPGVRRRVIDPTHLGLLRLFRRLPRRARRVVVRRIAPAYTVGAIALIRDDGGRVLLIRQSYRDRWGLPGGLVKRGEHPAAAVERETVEEIGLRPVLIDAGTVVLDLAPRRVDVVFQAVLAAGATPTPTSPEIIEVRWFDRDRLPDIQVETQAALDCVEAGDRLRIVSDR